LTGLTFVEAFGEVAAEAALDADDRVAARVAATLVDLRAVGCRADFAAGFLTPDELATTDLDVRLTNALDFVGRIAAIVLAEVRAAVIVVDADLAGRSAAAEELTALVASAVSDEAVGAAVAVVLAGLTDDEAGGDVESGEGALDILAVAFVAARAVAALVVVLADLPSAAADAASDAAGLAVTAERLACLRATTVVLAADLSCLKARGPGSLGTASTVAVVAAAIGVSGAVTTLRGADRVAGARAAVAGQRATVHGSIAVFALQRAGRIARQALTACAALARTAGRSRGASLSLGVTDAGRHRADVVVVADIRAAFGVARTRFAVGHARRAVTATAIITAVVRRSIVAHPIIRPILGGITGIDVAGHITAVGSVVSIVAARAFLVAAAASDGHGECEAADEQDRE
jgi:hypothetical protein